MDLTTDITKVKELLDKATTIVIATHENPTFDSIGSALTLSIGLASLGKKVTVVCPDPMTVELSSFIGVQRVTREIANKNFVISLDYVDGSIDKVSYNIEGNKFNLVIEPRAGYEGFSEDKVHYLHGGASADLIFTVDTLHLGGLKKVYDDNKDLFTSKSVINIDRHPNNAKYGVLNLVDQTASSTVEIVSQFLSHSGVALTQDIATNVVNALYGATNNFQNPNVSVASFELAAACFKAGGKRFAKSVTTSEELPIGESVAEKSPSGVIEAKLTGKSMSSQPVTTIPQGTAPKQSSGPVSGQAPSVGSGQAPPDWLKPKIFKSSSLI